MLLGSCLPVHAGRAKQLHEHSAYRETPDGEPGQRSLAAKIPLALMAHGGGFLHAGWTSRWRVPDACLAGCGFRQLAGHAACGHLGHACCPGWPLFLPRRRHARTVGRHGALRIGTMGTWRLGVFSGMWIDGDCRWILLRSTLVPKRLRDLLAVVPVVVHRHRSDLATGSATGLWPS